MVDGLRHRFDYVVLDGASAVGDEAFLAADSVLLVLAQNRTTRVQVTAILDRFEQLGVSTLGAVRVRPGRGPTPASAATTASPVTEGPAIDRVEARAQV